MYPSRQRLTTSLCYPNKEAMPTPTEMKPKATTPSQLEAVQTPNQVDTPHIITACAPPLCTIEPNKHETRTLGAYTFINLNTTT